MTHQEHVLVLDIMRVWSNSCVDVQTDYAPYPRTRLYLPRMPDVAQNPPWKFCGDKDRLLLIWHSMVMDSIGTNSYYNRTSYPQRLYLSAFTRPMPQWKAVQRLASMKLERFVAYKFQVPARIATAIIADIPRTILVDRHLLPPMSTHEAFRKSWELGFTAASKTKGAITSMSTISTRRKRPPLLLSPR